MKKQDMDDIWGTPKIQFDSLKYAPFLESMTLVAALQSCGSKITTESDTETARAHF